MWKALQNAIKIPEVRDRIIFTFLMLLVSDLVYTSQFQG